MTQDNSIRKISVIDKIGETTEFFKHLMHGVKEITLDLKQMTYINSIGVKNWILWVNKVPKDCKVTLHNCPFMMVSQASTVVGFLRADFKVESFFAPFLCPKCEEENIAQLIRGQHYDHATAEKEKWVSLPKNIACPKCKPPVMCEPDFFEDKTFKFLTP